MYNILTPSIEIIRLVESEALGTIGVLKINKNLFCNTLEPADRENKSSVSSIPVQQYMVKRINSPKHGETFRVVNVPDRSYINFHSGKTAKHTEGCMILGEFNFVSGTMDNSKETFKRFIDTLHGINRFHLTIKECY